MKKTKKGGILSELDGIKVQHKKEPFSEKLYQKKRHERNVKRLGHE